MASQRACDGCTLCCFTHSVHVDRVNLTKAFDWCTHCEVGLGCRIHETTQPDVCRQWKCAWLEGWGTEEEQPKKTGIVLEWRYTRLGKTLVMLASTSDAFGSDYAQRVTRYYAKERVPILRFHMDGRRELVFEKGILVDNDILHCSVTEGIEITFVNTD